MSRVPIHDTTGGHGRTATYPTEAPDLSQCALCCDPQSLVGKTIARVHPVKGETDWLLVTTDGEVFVVTADLGFDENDQRTTEHWDMVMFDATEQYAAWLAANPLPERPPGSYGPPTGVT